MKRIFLPSSSPEDWRRLLGDPEKHWRAGYSARTLAHSWEEANGLPREIAALLKTIGDNPELLIAIPEHKVPLPGATLGESQNDVLALARAGDRTIALAVEGKANEPFDQPLAKWLSGASEGKKIRLAALCEHLGLCQPLPDELHYQLLHRTASAIIEARRFKTDVAAMIVQSFSAERLWFDAFARFTGLFGIEAEPDRLYLVRPDTNMPLYIGWACGNLSFLSR